MGKSILPECMAVIGIALMISAAMRTEPEEILRCATIGGFGLLLLIAGVYLI